LTGDRTSPLLTFANQCKTVYKEGPKIKSVNNSIFKM
jgi:hypothetical protein